MLPQSVLITLVPFVVAGPIAVRQSLGSGLGSGLGGSAGGLPSLPGLGSGSGDSAGGLPSLPGLGSGGSSGGLPSLPGLGSGSGSGGSAGGLPSLPGLGSGSGGSAGGLPSLPGLGSGGSSGGLPTLPGLGSGSGGSTGGLPSLPTGLPGLGGGSGSLPGGSAGGDTSSDSPSSAPAAAQPTPAPASADSTNAARDAADSPFGNFLGGSSGGSTGGLGGLGGLGGSTGGSTQNGLSGACKDVTVIFARGTSEMGNVGSAAGPPFFAALSKQLGDDKVAVQGVDYAASVGGIMQMGDTAGTAKMASLVEQAATKCPNTKIVMSGYSQGAMLVHNSAKSIPAAALQKVAAVVNFGDPFQRQAIQGIDADRVKIICHTGDGVCAGTAAITPDHLTYSQDATAAAQFVASKVGK
ncbi:hypothetical protein ACHAPI_002914 [Fusarium lateritium]